MTTPTPSSRQKRAPTTSSSSPGLHITRYLERHVAIKTVYNTQGLALEPEFLEYRFNPPPPAPRQGRCFRHQPSKHPCSLRHPNETRKRLGAWPAETCRHQHFSWSLRCLGGCEFEGPSVILVVLGQGCACRIGILSFCSRHCGRTAPLVS
jgi:hypothetical protein